MFHVSSLQLPHTASLHFSTQNPSPLAKRTGFACTASSALLPTLTTTSTDTPIQTTTPTPTPTPTPTQTLVPTPTPSQTPSTSPSSIISPTTHSRASVDSKLYPWLIVGIGNPGNKFQKTRHNVGFEVIDAIAQAEGIRLNTIQQRALTGKGQIGSTQVLLAKPQTYVNLTGQSVGPLAAYYRIPVQHILVIYDDVDLEFGLMRLASRGGHTTNNGVKSVIEHLKGCRVFPRLRIGIGSVPGTMDPGAYVLQRFDEPEREEMDELIAQAPILIREMITEGIETTASKWNEIRKSRMQLTPEEQEFLKRI